MPHRDMELNLSQLEALLNLNNEETLKEESTNRVSFKDNKGRFTKIGFDMFRETANNTVWQVEKDDNGEEYLIRTSFSSEENISTKKGPWTATPNREGTNITVAYCGTPVQQFSSHKYRYASAEAHNFAEFVLEKLQGEDFVREMFAEQSPAMRRIVAKQHPELILKMANSTCSMSMIDNDETRNMREKLTEELRNRPNIKEMNFTEEDLQKLVDQLLLKKSHLNNNQA